MQCVPSPFVLLLRDGKIGDIIVIVVVIVVVVVAVVLAVSAVVVVVVLVRMSCITTIIKSRRCIWEHNRYNEYKIKRKRKYLNTLKTIVNILVKYKKKYCT
jgi:cell division protein FtsW (lipid II flippase)